LGAIAPCPFLATSLICCDVNTCHVQHVCTDNLAVWFGMFGNHQSGWTQTQLNALDQWRLHRLLGIKWYQFVLILKCCRQVVNLSLPRPSKRGIFLYLGTQCNWMTMQIVRRSCIPIRRFDETTRTLSDHMIKRIP